MEGKEGRIAISSEIDEETRRVNILVSDNGKGIPPHLVKQVFLPGYSTKKRGWGLGLAFVKRIVEDYHQGRITIKESTVGVGTLFVVSLPYETPLT
ncbi:MAG: ATP-binding protein, partial [bacterium]|nr:ATP-binding protein [bacterium]